MLLDAWTKKLLWHLSTEKGELCKVSPCRITAGRGEHNASAWIIIFLQVLF